MGKKNWEMWSKSADIAFLFSFIKCNAYELKVLKQEKELRERERDAEET